MLTEKITCIGRSDEFAVLSESNSSFQNNFNDPINGTPLFIHLLSSFSQYIFRQCKMKLRVCFTSQKAAN